MSELLRELEEDIRQERIDKLWKHGGKVLLAISAAIILVTAAYELLEYRHRSVAMERTDIFLAGVEHAKSADYNGAIAQFDKLTQDEKSSYYGIAMLKKAAAQVAAGDKEGAIKTYKTLSAQPGIYGQLAKLYASADGTIVDAPDDKSAPFYYSLRELKAWQLFDKGKKDESIKLFVDLYQDTSAPPSMHIRVREALQQVAPEKLL